MQEGDEVSLSDFRGQRLYYFYPKANTDVLSQ